MERTLKAVAERSSRDRGTVSLHVHLYADEAQVLEDSPHCVLVAVTILLRYQTLGGWASPR